MLTVVVDRHPPSPPNVAVGPSVMISTIMWVHVNVPKMICTMRDSQHNILEINKMYSHGIPDLPSYRHTNMRRGGMAKETAHGIVRRTQSKRRYHLLFPLLTSRIDRYR